MIYVYIYIQIYTRFICFATRQIALSSDLSSIGNENWKALIIISHKDGYSYFFFIIYLDYN